ncbi:Ribosome biogenesis GTPase A [Tetrabaena socialis]|uniref:Ribosome biogenesis GTPase A n=1 Tax=Tetrabaena socialis TaxID=47790 RepID=A0A2J8AEG1_9CHLO|nr:Ribosome biogenesis GTPase A [Tetrabaena socialis]|eukprot:PNH10910.1 Ribosome biogenesis GTPase A [Tetrabaena socialis]
MSRLASWFPGHMARALRQMEQRLKHIDLVLELRDARVPLSSANPDLERLARHKRRLVLLNKADMADPVATQAACSLLRSQGLWALPCVALRDGSAGKVLDAALSVLRAERASADLSLVLVAGLPNTGKSSLINALKRAAQRQDVRNQPPSLEAAVAREGRTHAHADQQGGGRGDGPGGSGKVGRDGGPGQRRGSSGEGGGVAVARALFEVASLQELPPAQWHPGLEDSTPAGASEGDAWDSGYYAADEADGGGSRGAGAGDASRRVTELLRRLSKGAGALDAGRRAALQRGVLQAFKSGALGRYTLDEVPPHGADGGGGG